MSTINTNIGGLGGGYTGDTISTGGITTEDAISAIEEEQRTAYVSDASQLPPPVGDEITLTQAALGGKNIVRFTQSVVDLGDKVLILDNVALNSNGSLNPTVITNNPSKPLIRNVLDTAVTVRNLRFANLNGATPVGKIFDLKGTNGITPGLNLTIENITVVGATKVGVVSGYFLIQLNQVAFAGTLFGGLTFGTPTNPSAVTINISKFSQIQENAISGNTFDIDSTVPGVTQLINFDTCSILPKLGGYGVNVVNIANINTLNMVHVDFSNGSGSAFNGFNSESPGVAISEDSKGRSGDTTFNTTPIMWWAEYKDNATQVTPTPLPFGVDTLVTNDGLNGEEKHLPSFITELYDTTNNKIDLSGVPIGRTLTVIVSLEVNISQNNTSISIFAKGLDIAATVFNADTITVARKSNFVAIEKAIDINVVDADLQANGAEIYLNLVDPGTSSGSFRVVRIKVKRG